MVVCVCCRTMMTLCPMAAISGKARPDALKYPAPGSAVPELRYALTAAVWYAGCGKMSEKPPPDAKFEMAYETACSVPLSAQVSPADAQIDGGLVRSVVDTSSVAPTAVMYGDEPGNDGRRCGSEQVGSVRPLAPESPAAASSEIPRSAIFWNWTLTA